MSQKERALIHRCWAEIDLSAFERNLNRIQVALPCNVRYLAVVKADAYGHGMPQIVRRLMQSGVDCFAVANTREAIEIRQIGAGWPILLLSPLLPEEDELLVEHDLTATVSTLDECERLQILATKRNSKIKVHLKVDTGMGRLGIWHTEGSALLESINRMSRLVLSGIYTHFSSASSDLAFTQTQRERFLAVIDKVATLNKNLLIHADNSAGIDTLHGNSPFNAVRIGLLQFGIPPCPKSALELVSVEPVFSFHTRVGLVKELPRGTYISYDRSFRLLRDSRIAILTAGYADGVPLGLSNRGEVLLHGKRCPILGRVTMDQTIIDVSDCPSVKIGDHVILIGKDHGGEITASEFSSLASTITWETLCSVTKRVTRVYIGARDL